MSEIPYGKCLKTSEMKYASTVENGLDCNCICPKCGGKLVARNRGLKKKLLIFMIQALFKS